MTPPVILTPKGFIAINRQGKADLVMRMEWDPGFQPRWQNNYSLAQKFVDNAVLAGCAPYVPLRTGMLVMTGILGTDVGSGTVSWIAPYARRNYYSKRAPGSMTGALRGPFWFARWKPIGAPGVIAGARKLAGGS